MSVLSGPTLEGVRWGQTTREGGCSVGGYASFNLAPHVGEAPAITAANWHALPRLIGFGRGELATCHQVHGIQTVHARAGGHHVVDADALYSTTAHVGVGVYTADCVPVLYAVPGRGVAAAHCGWRGAAAGLAGATLRVLAKALDVSASEVHIWLGASIAQCSYEVGGELRDVFRDEFLAARADGKYLLDVGGAVVADLLGAGASETRVRRSTVNTYVDPRCYSYRRDGAGAGRMLSYVRLG